VVKMCRYDPEVELADLSELVKGEEQANGVRPARNSDHDCLAFVWKARSTPFGDQISAERVH